MYLINSKFFSKKRWYPFFNNLQLHCTLGKTSSNLHNLYQFIDPQIYLNVKTHRLRNIAQNVLQSTHKMFQLIQAASTVETLGQVRSQLAQFTDRLQNRGCFWLDASIKYNFSNLMILTAMCSFCSMKFKFKCRAFLVFNRLIILEFKTEWYSGTGWGRVGGAFGHLQLWSISFGA